MNVVLHTCSHCRIVVWADGKWWHVTPDGRIGGSECIAGVYKATIPCPSHPAVQSVLDRDAPSVDDYPDWKTPPRFDGQHGRPKTN